jgi:hypothetical protein
MLFCSMQVNSLLSSKAIFILFLFPSIIPFDVSTQMVVMTVVHIFKYAKFKL